MDEAISPLVKRIENGHREGAAIDAAGRFEPEGRGQVPQFFGKVFAGMIDVHADTGDGKVFAGSISASFDEDAGQLAPVGVEVIWPLDLHGEAGRLLNGVRHGGRRPCRQSRPVFEG